jgi:hypothetical protein
MMPTSLAVLASVLVTASRVGDSQSHVESQTCLTEASHVHNGRASHGRARASSVWNVRGLSVAAAISQPASRLPDDGPLPPVFITTVLSPRECDAIIAAAEEAAAARGGWQTARHVRASTVDVSALEYPALRALAEPIATAAAVEAPQLFGTGGIVFLDLFVIR